MLDELSINYCSLGRCKKIYTALCIIYVILFLSCIGDVLSIIVYLAILAAEYYGIYKHKDIPAIIGPLAWILWSLMTGAISFGGAFVGITILMLILDLGSIPLALFSNRKYRWLEEQPGFPYFNQRFEEQKIDKVQHDIKPDYVTSYENMRKTETDQMKELDITAPGEIDNNNTPTGNYMDSI